MDMDIYHGTPRYDLEKITNPHARMIAKFLNDLDDVTNAVATKPKKWPDDFRGFGSNVKPAKQK